MAKNKGEVNTISGIIKVLSIILFILLQLFAVFLVYRGTYLFSIYAKLAFYTIKIGSVIYLLYKPINPSYRITWIILILAFPVFGLLTFIFFGNSNAPKKLKVKSREIREESNNHLIYDDDIYSELDYNQLRQANYLKETTGYPLYKNNKIEYLKTGEEYFNKMIEDMKKAEKYIFLEYFIIAKGKLWDQIFEVIKEKAQSGIHIYIITDEWGAMRRLPEYYRSYFYINNIHTMVFNPFTPVISTHVNYRDHRKITIIDGKIAYTGGLNIGDEYNNTVQRFKYWKDFGVRIEGNSTTSFITMFIRMWNSKSSNSPLLVEDFVVEQENKGEGYVIPFCDGPDNSSNPAENTYMNLINTAKKSIYITTPYLILDNELLTALKNSAKSGIDVRIVIPHVPDKKLVFILSRSYYEELLKSGVKIYEYEPGFIHGKMCIIDEDTSVIGTINFDFRSLYLHYECGVWTHDTEEEKKMSEDFYDIINKSIEIKLEKWRNRSIIKKIAEAILRAFGPLL